MIALPDRFVNILECLLETHWCVCEYARVYYVHNPISDCVYVYVPKISSKRPPPLFWSKVRAKGRLSSHFGSKNEEKNCVKGRVSSILVRHKHPFPPTLIKFCA